MIIKRGKTVLRAELILWNAINWRGSPPFSRSATRLCNVLNIITRIGVIETKPVGRVKRHWYVYACINRSRPSGNEIEWVLDRYVYPFVLCSSKMLFILRDTPPAIVSAWTTFLPISPHLTRVDIFVQITGYDRCTLLLYRIIIIFTWLMIIMYSSGSLFSHFK